jgi:hypothetical protein
MKQTNARRVKVKGLKLILAGSFLLAGGVISCGGGGSGIFGGFDTVLVGVASVNPPKLESDTLVLIDNNNDGVCDSISFQDDSLQITITSEVVKDPLGQPITTNPSQVYIDR